VLDAQMYRFTTGIQVYRRNTGVHCTAIEQECCGTGVVEVYRCTRVAQGYCGRHTVKEYYW